MLITDSAALASFCDAVRGAPYIAVDTEFMREKSYFARLCLVQVAHGDHAAAIDPLASGMDMGPLRDLLSDTSTVKVLHSAVQDLEIFLQKIGAVPAPVFDTQIAAAVCGHGDQPGYAKLVGSMLGEQLDKASQATDWSLRPLSDRQIAYALGDVTHLCRIYEILLDELDTNGRGEWVAEDMEALLEPSRYQVVPGEAYRRIKMRRPKRRDLAVLRELAAWREETAMARDTPRNWIVRDDALAEIALHRPNDRNQLGRVRTLKPHVAESATRLPGPHLPAHAQADVALGHQERRAVAAQHSVEFAAMGIQMRPWAQEREPGVHHSGDVRGRTRGDRAALSIAVEPGSTVEVEVEPASLVVDALDPRQRIGALHEVLACQSFDLGPDRLEGRLQLGDECEVVGLVEHGLILVRTGLRGSHPSPWSPARKSPRSPISDSRGKHATRA